MSELLNTIATYGLASPMGLPSRRPDDYNKIMGDMGKSVVAGTVGLPADLVAIAALPHVVNNPDVTVEDAFQAPLTSEWFGKKMGVDVTSPAFVLSQFLSPSPTDLAAPVAKGLAKLSPDMMAALSGMTAWHGSPHKFDKFQMDKIGTGEGAQAYGHGLYFAESPDVAGQYAKLCKYMDDTPKPTYRGQEVWSPDAQLWVDNQDEIAPMPREIELIEQNHLIEQEIDAVRREWHELGSSQRHADEFDSLNERYKANHDERIAIQDGYANTNLYEVDIPDEAVARFLDWDAPLSEQPESVRRALGALDERSADIAGVERLIRKSVKEDFKIQRLDDDFGFKFYYESPERAASQRWQLGGTDRVIGYANSEEEIVQRLLKNAFGKELNKTGGNLYARLVESLGGSRQASEYLNSLGIPGIKYLDGNSRSAGEGTRNLVVFDDELVNVISRNGEAVE